MLAWKHLQPVPIDSRIDSKPQVYDILVEC